MHDPLRAAFEIREQLASEKRKLAFFFGAGTSMAAGSPGIDELTKKVFEQLPGPEKNQLENVMKGLAPNSNIENILDRIRTLLELFGQSEDIEFSGLKGFAVAKKLETQICQTICKIVCEHPLKGLNSHLIFSKWLRALHSNRDWPVEIFTTNYDLLLEQALEDSGVPFFDGFVGSVNPFFVPESVEAETDKKDESVYPPKTWTRLWKLHGSINWCIQKRTIVESITRLSGYEGREGKELVIFPSREKYTQSRKLPFLAFHDRLRKFLSDGECLLVIIGYSFSDQHINEIIFQGLRSNPRLAIAALAYGEQKINLNPPQFQLQDNIIGYGKENKNLSIYGPDKACIAGLTEMWGEPNRKRKETEIWPFWNEELKYFTLGDFNCFASFLELFIGFQSASAYFLSNAKQGTLE
jgi:hypothetical protein